MSTRESQPNPIDPSMEEFQTSIFERTKEKSRKRLLYNLAIFGGIVAIWILYFIIPFIGLKIVIPVSAALIGLKLYDDKYMGITAYGDRSAPLVIAEQYLEIRAQEFRMLTSVI